MVLDMDECMIHSSGFSDEATAQQVAAGQVEAVGLGSAPVAKTIESFKLRFNDGVSCTVYKRPGLDAFLQECAADFDTYVFTAGTQDYAEPLLDVLDPHRSLFQGRFYRQDCRRMPGSRQYLKDLEAVARKRGLGEGLGRMVLVDNNPVSFVCQPDNGIPVPDFHGIHDDPNSVGQEGGGDSGGDSGSNRGVLADVLVLLRRLDQLEDVRPELRELFGLRQQLGPVRSQIFLDDDDGGGGGGGDTGHTSAGGGVSFAGGRSRL